MTFWRQGELSMSYGSGVPKDWVCVQQEVLKIFPSLILKCCGLIIGCRKGFIIFRLPQLNLENKFCILNGDIAVRWNLHISVDYWVQITSGAFPVE